MNIKKNTHNNQSNRKYPVGNNKKNPKHQHQLHPWCESRSYGTTQYYMPFVCASFLSDYTTEFLTSVFYNRYIR